MSDYRGDEFRIEPPPSATSGALAASLPENGRRGLIPYVAVGMAAVAFAGFLWYAYRQSGAPVAPGSVPEIRADTNPFKTQPADPGGLQVPHQDSTLLNGAPVESKPENLLAAPEVPPVRQAEPPPVAVETAPAEPVAMPSVAETEPATAKPVTPETPIAVAPPKPVMPPRPPGPAANPVAAGNPKPIQVKPVTTAPLPPPDTPAGDIAAALNAPPSVATHPELTGDAPTMIDPHADQFPGTPEKPAEVKPVATAKPIELPNVDMTAAKPVVTPPVAPQPEKPVSVAPPKPAAPAPIAANAKGNWAVQIGAVRSDADAKSEWKRLQRKYSAQLGGLKLTVKTANLGDRGTWYRIQGGPVDKPTATRICQELKAASVGCLVAKH